MAKTVADREKALLEEIENKKKKLDQLREKRKKEIGELAVKAGLNKFENKILKSAFEKLSKELDK